MPSPPASSSNLPSSPQRENRRTSLHGESPSLKAARRGSKDTPNGENIGPSAGRSASPTPVNGSGFDEVQSVKETPPHPSVMVTGEVRYHLWRDGFWLTVVGGAEGRRRL
jgi:hypothetical protein